MGDKTIIVLLKQACWCLCYANKEAGDSYNNQLKHRGSDSVNHYQHEITKIFPSVLITDTAWSHMMVAKQLGAADCLKPSDALLYVKHILTSDANKYTFTRVYPVHFECLQAAGIIT